MISKYFFVVHYNCEVSIGYQISISLYRILNCLNYERELSLWHIYWNYWMIWFPIESSYIESYVYTRKRTSLQCAQNLIILQMHEWLSYAKHILESQNSMHHSIDQSIAFMEFVFNSQLEVVLGAIYHKYCGNP